MIVCHKRTSYTNVICGRWNVIAWCSNVWRDWDHLVSVHPDFSIDRGYYIPCPKCWNTKTIEIEEVVEI